MRDRNIAQYSEWYSNESLLIDIYWINKTADKIYKESKSHHGFKEFISPPYIFGALCLMGKHEEMPYRISIFGEVASLTYTFRFDVYADIKEVLKRVK